MMEHPFKHQIFFKKNNNHRFKGIEGIMVVEKKNKINKFIDSKEFLYREISDILPPVSLVMTSYITIIQQKNQDIYLVCPSTSLTQILPNLHAVICVCAYTAHATLSHVDSCNHHHDRHTELFYHKVPQAPSL